MPATVAASMVAPQGRPATTGAGEGEVRAPRGIPPDIPQRNRIRAARRTSRNTVRGRHPESVSVSAHVSTRAKCPPWSRLTGAADVIETWGARLAPGAAGVVLLEAVKTQLALRSKPAAQRARARRAEGLAPQPAGMTRINPRAMDIADAYAALTNADPAAAARLNPADSTRVARALEVVQSTGRTLADWQSATEGGIADDIACPCRADNRQ